MPPLEVVMRVHGNIVIAAGADMSTLLLVLLLLVSKGANLIPTAEASATTLGCGLLPKTPFAAAQPPQRPPRQIKERDVRHGAEGKDPFGAQKDRKPIKKVIISSENDHRLAANMHHSGPNGGDRKEHCDGHGHLRHQNNCDAKVLIKRGEVIVEVPRGRGGNALRGIVILRGRQTLPRAAAAEYFCGPRHEH